MHAGSFLIADLFGNTSVKYRQEDDTLALAVKSGGRGGEGGGWHMMGDVVPSPDETLVGQIRGLRPVLELMKDVKKVFIPPIPRFVLVEAVTQNTMHPTLHLRSTRQKCSPNTSDSDTPSQKHSLIQRQHTSGLLTSLASSHPRMTQSPTKHESFAPFRIRTMCISRRRVTGC